LIAPKLEQLGFYRIGVDDQYEIASVEDIQAVGFSTIPLACPEPKLNYPCADANIHNLPNGKRISNLLKGAINITKLQVSLFVSV